MILAGATGKATYKAVDNRWAPGGAQNTIGAKPLKRWKPLDMKRRTTAGYEAVKTAEYEAVETAGYKAVETAGYEAVETAGYKSIEHRWM